MRRKLFFTSVGFVSVFLLHTFYVISKISRISAKWVAIGDTNPFSLYLRQQDYFIGLSYATAFAFTIYAFLKFIEGHNKKLGRNKMGLISAIGGIGFANILYFGLCFILGCCGSPMLVVYLSLFGASFLGFTKPLVLLITIVSVAVGVIWMNKEKKTVCCGEDEKCIDKKSNMPTKKPIDDILSELNEGMNLAKCRKCGCMKETLENLLSFLPSFHSDAVKKIEQLVMRMEPIKYACLGCEHCYPAVAVNIFSQAFPEATDKSLSCTFEVKEKTWPPIPGEYFSFCDGPDCPVAVSTLASVELAEKLASIRPKELCIVGKTETENIGIDKVIKNTITNPTIRILLLVGKDPEGHYSGKTMLALRENGVDGNMRVVGSPGKRPILRNVSRQEIDIFRKQVQVIGMIGCEDIDEIIEKIKRISENCKCEKCEEETSKITTVPVIQAHEPDRIEMDKAGYFVIIPNPTKKIIVLEHYSYDNKLLRVVEGKDARSIYWTIIKNGWITQLSHAAYLGKELMKAEISLKFGFKYVQDGQ
ncbi:MAG: DUF4346 domain-containing protein [Candidatus Jordarchaeaceae archaeon]